MVVACIESKLTKNKIKYLAINEIDLVTMVNSTRFHWFYQSVKTQKSGINPSELSLQSTGGSFTLQQGELSGPAHLGGATVRWRNKLSLSLCQIYPGWALIGQPPALLRSNWSRASL